jgi:hypothetical protein
MMVDALLAGGDRNARSSGMTGIGKAALTLVVILALPSTRAESSPGFISNDGQWPQEVSFLLRQGDVDFWFTPDGVVITEYHYGDCFHSPGEGLSSDSEHGLPAPTGRSVLRARFIDSSPCAGVTGEGLRTEYHNYFQGDDPSRWRSNVPLFDSIHYRDLYPGIDVLYYFDKNGLKYDLIVSPGTDPSRIALQYEGATSLEEAPNGSLLIEAGEMTLLEGRPEGWQMRGCHRIPVSISYHIHDNDTVTFEIADFDSKLPLVIDPPVELLYSSYLGGAELDFGTAIVIAADGSVLLGGSTRSSDFPTENPFQEEYGGSSDAFVVRMSADGAQLLSSTYLGGEAGDGAAGIEVDSNGTIYLAGDTSSEDFPTVNPIQEDQTGTDAFVSALASGGDELLFSTYLGGSMIEHSEGIALAPSGAVCVVGDTDSPDFPLQNPFQSTYTSPLYDAFITFISPGGDSLVYSTYLGGYGVDQAFDVFVDGDGSCYVAGRTSSYNFPVLNAFQGSFAGTMDAFAVKLSPDGSEMVFGTYLGGSQWDNGWAVGMHEGCLFVAGYTESLDFPTRYAFQEEFAGGIGDGYLTKLDPSGQELVFSTFFGGSLRDGFSGLCVDEGGSAFVTGFTYSPDLPLQNPWQSYLAGSCDAIAARFTPWGTELLWSTFLGGTGEDYGDDIEVDPAGNTHLIGTTYSADFPVLSPLQPELLGASDVFITTFGSEGTPVAPPSDELVPGVSPLSISPNPFQYVLQILVTTRYGSLDLSVYDLTGRRIECLATGTVEAGEHTFSWDASNCSCGVYFIEARMGSGASSVEKVLLLR